MKKLLWSLLVLAAPASAQTVFPSIQVNGQTDLRGNVVDTTGNLTINDAVDITGGKLTTLAAALGGAGLNLPPGTAPTSPVNGDLWTTSAGLFARINGSTVGPFSATSFPLLAPDGDENNPQFSFAADTNSGLWSDGDNSLVLSVDSQNGSVLALNKLSWSLIDNEVGATGVIAADAGLQLAPLYALNVSPTGSEVMTFLGGPMNDGTALFWGNDDGTGAELILVPNEMGMDPDTRFFSVGVGVNGGNGEMFLASPWGLPIELFSGAGGTSGIVAIGVTGTDYIEPRSNVRSDTVNPLNLFSTAAADHFLTFETDFGAGQGRMYFNDGMGTAIDGVIEAGELTLQGNVTITGTCTGCGSGGTPGGAEGNVQYNDGAGGFGAEAAFSYDDTADQLILAGASFFADPGGGTDELTVTSGAVGIGATLAVDAGGGNDELTVSSGAVAMIGTTSGGSSGGVDMTPSTGEFSVGFDSACSTTPTMTWDYYKIGAQVTIQVETGFFSCTGDSTSFTAAAGTVPAALRPPSPQVVYFPINHLQDNSTIVAQGGCLGIDFLGGVTILNSVSSVCDSSTWTASGNRVWSVGGPNTFTYLVTDP